MARRLRGDPDMQHIGLIALTGYGLADDQRRVLEAGFDMHLVKPVDIDSLMKAIASLSSGDTLAPAVAATATAALRP